MNESLRADECTFGFAERRTSELVNRIYKDKSPIEKLRLALECIELLTDESGFAVRNLSGNYIDLN